MGGREDARGGRRARGERSCAGCAWARPREEALIERGEGWICLRLGRPRLRRRAVAGCPNYIGLR